jgi:hypothetical protein
VLPAIRLPPDLPTVILITPRPETFWILGAVTISLHVGEGSLPFAIHSKGLPTKKVPQIVQDFLCAQDWITFSDSIHPTRGLSSNDKWRVAESILIGLCYFH